MKITFASANLQALCQQSKLAARDLGPLSAKKLQRRLAELFNADNVAELIAGRPHPLVGNRKGEFAVDLQGGDRLVFKSSHLPPLIKPDGSVDWSKVTAVTIVELGNYHD